MPRARQEIEIKFTVKDLRALQQHLQASGFRCVTPPTHEHNTLYDLPGEVLRQRGELLRLRRYGKKWILTYKAKGKAGRHKTRVETETLVADGRQMDEMLRALGFQPVFVYEKFRAEWSDGKGHVLLDETPIGTMGEIEGPARWIDGTARKLGVRLAQYVTLTYAALFFEWKRRTKNPAKNMTFHETGMRRSRGKRPAGEGARATPSLRI
jgi:adenylate cyclase class 2